jgi:tRNA-specific adenosine deaminase 1
MAPDHADAPAAAAPARPPPPFPDAAAANAIARAVQRRFASLPGSGKPARHEHTVLAGFVVATPSGSSGPPHYSVASLATGTKCLGAGRRREAAAARASLLHDSHAEALARRGLLLWLHAQLRTAIAADRSGSPAAADAAAESPALCCFRWLPARRRFALVPGVELFLYVSQPPCGDASILHGDGDDEEQDEDAQRNPPAVGGGRTGAKPIEPPPAEAAAAASSAGAAGPAVPQAGHVEPPARAQRRGALRRKPGKGDATLSMSCSDKLARWHVLGLQGALLASALDAPLRLSGVVVSAPQRDGGGSETWAAADVERATRRAVFERFAVAVEEAADALRERRGQQGGGDDSDEAAERLLRSAPRKPVAMAAQPPPPELGLAPSPTRRVPCGVAINWHSDDCGGGGGAAGGSKAEVTVGALGCRAGGGRAARDSPAARSRLSRAALAARYVELLEALLEEEEERQQQRRAPLVLSAAEARALPLGELKRRAAPAYVRAWAALLEGPGRPSADEQRVQFAGAWLRKPEEEGALAVADFAWGGASGGGRAADDGGGGDDVGERLKRARTNAERRS